MEILPAKMAAVVHGLLTTEGNGSLQFDVDTAPLPMQALQSA